MTTNDASKVGRWWERRSGRWFWGLTLVAVGGFWLVSNLHIVPEPAKVVVPALIVLWGIVALARGR